MASFSSQSCTSFVRRGPENWCSTAGRPTLRTFEFELDVLAGRVGICIFVLCQRQRGKPASRLCEICVVSKFSTLALDWTTAPPVGPESVI